MSVWNRAPVLALLMLGCSAEHTIANETTATQPVDALDISARTECIEICDADVTCERIESSALVQCATNCEASCQALEVAIAGRIAAGDNSFDGNTAPKLIRGVRDCHLATSCSAALDTQCQPSYLADEAAKVRQRTASGELNAIMSTTNCGHAFETGGLTCETRHVRMLDGESLSLTCERPDATAELWTCHCSENDVETKVVTGTYSDSVVDFSNLCWSSVQMTAFYRNEPSGASK